MYDVVIFEWVDDFNEEELMNTTIDEPCKLNEVYSKLENDGYEVIGDSYTEGVIYVEVRKENRMTRSKYAVEQCLDEETKEFD